MTLSLCGFLTRVYHGSVSHKPGKGLNGAMSMLEKARAISGEITQIRRKIHEYPELPFKEFETTRLVISELKSLGIKVVPLNSDVGVLGILEGEATSENPTVTALRADIDALPILERTGLPYASKIDGVMHACGHDGHTAVLIGVARVLSSLKKHLSGTVKFIFQPAEESLNGAKMMVEQGVLENPAVDTIVALHAWPQMDVGKVGFFDGPYMASADRFTITVVGKGAHGAYPHRTVDSVLTACQVVVGLQNIVSREIDALDSAVLSACTINGGHAFNVIPEEVTISGTIRCRNSPTRQLIKEKIERITKGITEAFGCTYRYEYEYGVPSLSNDPAVNDMLKAAADRALGPGNTVMLPIPAMSSEDFGIFLERVPRGAFFRLGIAVPGQAPPVVHNDRYDFNDDAIPYGIAILSQFVWDVHGKKE